MADIRRVLIANTDHVLVVERRSDISTRVSIDCEAHEHDSMMIGTFEQDMTWAVGYEHSRGARFVENFEQCLYHAAAMLSRECAAISQTDAFFADDEDMVIDLAAYFAEDDEDDEDEAEDDDEEEFDDDDGDEDEGEGDVDDDEFEDDEDDDEGDDDDEEENDDNQPPPNPFSGPSPFGGYRRP